MTRLARRLVPVLALIALAAAPAALADGDPASDYLISQPTFVPFSSKPDKAKADELVALLAASKKAGFELRVAVIAAASDLGSVPILYRKPDQYARFLGQELVYWYKGELLIVMPNGYGLYRNGKAPAADRAVLAALPAANTSDGNALTDSASAAVKALAARNGVDLSSVSSSDSGSSKWRDRAVIGVGFVVGLVLFGGVFFLRRRSARRG